MAACACCLTIYTITLNIPEELQNIAVPGEIFMMQHLKENKVTWCEGWHIATAPIIETDTAPAEICPADTTTFR